MLISDETENGAGQLLKVWQTEFNQLQQQAAAERVTAAIDATRAAVLEELKTLR